MAGTAGSVRGSAMQTPNSYGSVATNGQLVGFQTRAGYAPVNYGGGIVAVPALSPVTTPPNVGYGQYNAGTAPVGSVAGGGNQSNSLTDRGGYGGTFWQSPAPWAIGFMAFGLLWLRYVHFKPR